MRIVIDTNVIVSAVFFGGRPGQILNLLLHRHLEVVATDKIVAEYQATIDYLLERYGGKHIKLSIMPIIASMELIPQTEDIHICRDPDDDAILACALGGNAKVICSGDGDLLALDGFRGLEIMPPADFCQRMQL